MDGIPTAHKPNPPKFTWPAAVGVRVCVALRPPNWVDAQQRANWLKNEVRKIAAAGRDLEEDVKQSEKFTSR